MLPTCGKLVWWSPCCGKWVDGRARCSLGRQGDKATRRLNRQAGAALRQALTQRCSAWRRGGPGCQRPIARTSRDKLRGKGSSVGSQTAAEARRPACQSPRPGRRVDAGTAGQGAAGKEKPRPESGLAFGPFFGRKISPSESPRSAVQTVRPDFGRVSGFRFRTRNWGRFPSHAYAPQGYAARRARDAERKRARALAKAGGPSNEELMARARGPRPQPRRRPRRRRAGGADQGKGRGDGGSSRARALR